ncbi:hypothetical protein IGI37_003088 [Enterococcus sp. AZ194]|uniref:MerR family transcriptional regulator n=1 Tax=Enterococcus sp. AZ194 TaxID=2774629 RepID=UPI003F220C2A
MYLISEFSKMLKVSKRMLRYYEKLNLFTPSHINEQTGYRYYSESDILKVEKIMFLRDLRFSFPEIKELISYPEAELNNEIIKKKEELKREIEVIEKEVAKIDIYLENRSVVGNNSSHFFKIKSLPPSTVISYRDSVKNYSDETDLWDKLNEFVRENNIETTKNHFSIYELNHNEIEVCIELVTKRDLSQIPRTKDITIQQVDNNCLVACKTIYGSMEKIEDTYCEFYSWLSNSEQYTTTGKSKHVYVFGPQNERNNGNYVTELQFEIIY